MNTDTQKAVLPVGFHHAYAFAVFNALSYQVVLNSPMVLYAKSLGASATVLGIITGMMPLLVIFQIPAAPHVDRVGCKRFVYAGWGTRVGFIFGMSLIPLTWGFLDTTSRLGLLLMLLFGFNLSRGISSAGWLPWITSIVPASVRGHYLSRDAAWQNLASFVCYLLCALCLGPNPGPWQFSLVFLFSAVTGAVSLSFLKRIPEPEACPQLRTSAAQVPWLEMARYAPFRKLLRMVVAWSVAYGGMTAFTVAFLKVEVGMSEGKILLVSSISFLGGLSSLWLIGARLDRLGSKPVLAFALSAWLAIASGWTLIAGHVWTPRLGLILLLQVLMGLSAALVTMSNTRLAMGVVPVMGRNHFFALFSVLSSLSLGLAPILWGLFIDAIGARHPLWLGVEWNGFSLFFAAVVGVLVITVALAQRLEEPEAATFEQLVREILIQSPQRVLCRLLLRE